MFYYKILVWLFWLALAAVSACVPFIWLILCVGLWSVKDANERK